MRMRDGKFKVTMFTRWITLVKIMSWTQDSEMFLYLTPVPYHDKKLLCLQEKLFSLKDIWIDDSYLNEEVYCTELSPSVSFPLFCHGGFNLVVAFPILVSSCLTLKRKVLGQT